MPLDLERPFREINIALLTVSDSRGPDEDVSGNLLAERISRAGHHLIERAYSRDEALQIGRILETWCQRQDIDAIITTGGTGLTGRDVTPEAVEAVSEKLIPGFGELFRLVSYENIGVSALQSRALAGLCKGTYIFALPGSKGACRDGWDRILSAQLDYRFRPCNLVELMPRLKEK